MGGGNAWELISFISWPVELQIGWVTSSFIVGVKAWEWGRVGRTPIVVVKGQHLGASWGCPLVAFDDYVLYLSASFLPLVLGILTLKVMVVQGVSRSVRFRDTM